MGTRAHVAPHQFRRVECNLIAEYLVMKGPLADHPDNFDSVLSLLNFLRVGMIDPSFRSRVSSDFAYQIQCRHESDPKKRKKATTNGYIEGSQLERDDHLVAVNNELLKWEKSSRRMQSMLSSTMWSTFLSRLLKLQTVAFGLIATDSPTRTSCTPLLQRCKTAWLYSTVWVVILNSSGWPLLTKTCQSKDSLKRSKCNRRRKKRKNESW